MAAPQYKVTSLVMSIIAKHDDRHVIVRTNAGTMMVQSAGNLSNTPNPVEAVVVFTPHGPILDRIVSDVNGMP